MNSKTNKGITLIALVITIIVLLILAGVTINMVLGDDGIIKQAGDAKQAQVDADKREKEEMQKGEGNIDLYTLGTVANKVQVGDYVKYDYLKEEATRTYTTPEVDTGKSINATPQNFDSSETGSEKITKWRVLSKKDGIVKLISEQPISSLTINGTEGYINGPTVLNEICDTLYSSDIGKARHINIEDVNEVTGYSEEKIEINAEDGEIIELPYGITIREAARYGGSNDQPFNMNYFSKWTPVEGENVEDYQLTEYRYNGASQMKTTEINGSIGYKLLFRNINDKNYTGAYWIASSCIWADWPMGEMKIAVRMINNGSVTSETTYSLELGEGISRTKQIRPIVVLKSGLKVADEKDETGAWIIVD